MVTLFQAEEGHRGLLVLQVPVPAMLGPDRCICLFVCMHVGHCHKKFQFPIHNILYVLYFLSNRAGLPDECHEVFRVRRRGGGGAAGGRGRRRKETSINDVGVSSKADA